MTKTESEPATLSFESNHSNTPNGSAKPKVYTKEKIALLRFKRRLFKHLWLVRVGTLIAVVAGLFLFFSLLSFVFSRKHPPNYLSLVTDFVFAPASKVVSFEDRTNVLVLGRSGAGHDSPDLTDTIIFASLSLKKPSVVLVSIPRDIWIPSIRAKLNSAYYWGKQKQSGGGLTLTKALVEEIVGQPVHYGVVVDFNGFMQIIDVLGGVEVKVVNSFVDEKYPIPGKENDLCNGDKDYRCRYETLSFTKGVQTMDGATALKFVRSRNAEGQEGTDLAREARQQKVLFAIKEKILSPTFFLSPRKILSAWKVVNASLETDATSSVGVILGRRLLMARNDIKTFVLPESYLLNPPLSTKYDWQYVFLPKVADWQEVKTWVRSLF